MSFKVMLNTSLNPLGEIITLLRQWEKDKFMFSSSEDEVVYAIIKSLVE